jgi:steroid Delta-isomerase
MSHETSTAQRAAVDQAVVFFETLSPQLVEQLGTLYTADAYFKDPFNEVKGVAQIQRIFRHMYVALHDPHFVVTARVVDGDQCFLTWEFRFRFRRFNPRINQTVRGGSHLKLTSDGLIQFHRDYWDAAEELYEKLPLVGGLMRWIKRRANL